VYFATNAAVPVFGPTREGEIKSMENSARKTKSGSEGYE
jgi:hypothetical protein